jgi:tRNA (cytidine/uridine-2'-O-)-methyltransferase
MTAVHEWDSLEACLAGINSTRWFAVSTRGQTRFDQPLYTSGDTFVFGPETRGLPQDVLESCPVENRIRLPMVPGNRSLNLSNAVAVVTFEAWRQLGYRGGV